MQDNKLLRKQSFGILILSLLLALPACLPVNYAPYNQKKYYCQTKAIITQLPAAQALPDTVQVGWAKVNITPLQKAPMAGYGKRKGRKFQGIHDSIFVRAFVFKNKYRKVAFVTMDLLIVPMSVTAELEKILPTIGFSRSQTYLTATHSHSSLGGWARKPAGYVMAGKYNKNIVNSISKAIVSAIQAAENNSQPAQIGYSTVLADAFVRNRLVGDEGTRDNLVRLLKIKQTTGKTALLFTYAAHATCLPASELSLSGDYPAALVQKLENDPDLDFAAFGAGAVGSHSPVASGENYTKIDNLSEGLKAIITQKTRNIRLDYVFNVNSVAVPLYLRSPHWRVSQNWRLAPPLFYLVFGKYPATLSGLRIGDVLLVGTPCDFSGELVPAIVQQLTANKEKLVITSFNGGYIGYITPDKYYQLKKYETHDMNLFGPYNGAYISEMINLLLQKL